MPARRETNNENKDNIYHFETSLDEQKRFIIKKHLNGVSHRNISALIGMPPGEKYQKQYRPLVQSMGLSLERDAPINAAEWDYMKKLYDWRCLSCGKTETEAGFPLERDRIKPETQGGTYARWNVQPLCRSCNASKGERYMDYRPPASSFVESNETEREKGMVR